MSKSKQFGPASGALPAHGTAAPTAVAPSREPRGDVLGAMQEAIAERNRVMLEKIAQFFAPATGCTFDLSTAAGMEAYATCLQLGNPKIKTAVNTSIDLVGWAWEQVEEADPVTGQVESWRAITLYGADGIAISGGSVGVKKSLLVLVLRYGLPPWQAPVRVTFRNRDLGKDPVSGEQKTLIYLEEASADRG